MATTPARSRGTSTGRATPKKSPARTEVEVVDDEPAERITITWQGLEITVPGTADDWDVDTIEAFELGRAIGAFRGLIGSTAFDQLKRDFQRLHGHPMTRRDTRSLGDAIAAAVGFGSLGG